MGVDYQIHEHETDGLNPKERLVKALKEEEERGMAVTKAWVDLWRENLEYFFSEQLAGRKRHKDWDWIIVNYIWPSAMQEAAKISRHEPQFVCDPWEPSDAEAAEAWQGWLQWTWERGLNDEGMRLEQLKAIICGKIYGYRVYKVYWEPRHHWDDRQKRWVGEVKGRLWKPSLFWATGAESVQEGNCGTVRCVELEYALDRWPDYARQLKEQAEKELEEMEAGGRTVPGQTGSSATYPGPGRGGQDRGPDYAGGSRLLDRVLDSLGIRARRPEDKTRYVKISETWFRDYSERGQEYVEPIPVQELLAAGRVLARNGLLLDAASGELLTEENWPQREPLKWKEPKFPNGRYVLRTGDVILNEDQEDQRYPYRLWPFVTSPHYLVPFMWQGTDAVQLVKTAQDMINVSVTHLVNHMKQYGDPKIAVERWAIDSPKPRDKEHFRIGSGAGSIIRLVRNGLRGFKILDPPQSSPVNFMLYQLFSQEFKNIVGLHDIAQGKKSPGDLTATESSYLAMSANDRVHLQTVLEKNWIERIGILAAEICQRQYEPERLVRILGENALPGVVAITSKLKEVRYDIHVQIGSSLPLDEEKRIARHMQANGLLLGPPSPMLPELLRVLEIPNWRKILERHAIWRQWMGFLQTVEQVKAGKLPAEQALQMIMRNAAQALAPYAQAGPTPGPGGPGAPGPMGPGGPPGPGPQVMPFPKGQG